ncbi:MAG: hypothetical protein H7Z15_17895 [Rhizobacter sp.]|nr:hypothetical protein [Rhizobacter sp.]
MNDCRVTNAYNTGLYAKDLQMLEVSGVELEACAERGASRTAVWLENVRDLRARFGKVEASAGMASPARVVLRGIGAGALSVPSTSAGRRVSVMAEESPTLGVELR